MKCQSCSEAEATVHFKEVVDGSYREIHFCERCAGEKGFHLILEQNKLSIATQFIWMAENLYPESSTKVGSVQCPSCGLRYSHFTRTGRLGCPECYTAFDAQLQRILRRVHGATTHTGRGPERGASQRKGGAVAPVETEEAPERAAAEERAGAFAKARESEQLRQKLTRAIEREDYELAARIRDQLRRRESGPSDEDAADGRDS